MSCLPFKFQVIFTSSRKAVVMVSSEFVGPTMIIMNGGEHEWVTTYWEIHRGPIADLKKQFHMCNEKLLYQILA